MAEGPFAGIRVLEFGQYVSVPYAAELLAHGGADVIKVEPITGDITRSTQRLIEGEGRQYVVKARGKRGIPVDLGTPEGQALAHRMAVQCDVVVSNMRPGAVDRMGLGYEQLAAENPALIYGEITGFGTTGPDAGRASLDVVAQAASGLMLSQRAMDGDRPVIGEAFLTDYMSGVLLAFGITAALRERDRTGRGQKVSTTLMQAGLALQQATANVFDVVDAWKPEFADWLESDHPTLTESLARRAENVPGYAFFYNSYATGDGAVVVGAVGNMRGNLLRLLGLAENDEGARPMSPRAASEDLLRRVREAIRTWSTTDLIAALDAARIPCGRVHFVEDVMIDPASLQAGFVYEADHPALGRAVLPTAPVLFSESRYEAASTSPAYGEHSQAVLRDLGWSDDEIEGLTRRRVVGLPKGESPAAPT